VFSGLWFCLCFLCYILSALTPLFSSPRFFLCSPLGSSFDFFSGLCSLPPPLSVSLCILSVYSLLLWLCVRPSSFFSFIFFSLSTCYWVFLFSLVFLLFCSLVLGSLLSYFLSLLCIFTFHLPLSLLVSFTLVLCFCCSSSSLGSNCLLFLSMSSLVCPPHSLWPSLAFKKLEDGLCSCVRASWLCGTNAFVSLRRNREIKVLLLLDCSTWPLEDNGQLRRRVPKRFWFPVESIPGLEMKKAMKSGSNDAVCILGGYWFWTSDI